MTNAISPNTFDLVCTMTGEIVPWDCICWRRSDAEGRLIPERIVNAFESDVSGAREVMGTVEQLDRETNARTGRYEVIPLAALNLQIVPSDFEEQTFEANTSNKETDAMTTETSTAAKKLILSETNKSIDIKEFKIDTSELEAASNVMSCFGDFENAVCEYNEALQAFNDAKDALDNEVSALRDAIQEAMDEIDARLEPVEKHKHSMKLEIERLQGEIDKLDELTEEMDEKRAQLDRLSDGICEPDGDEYEIQEGQAEFEDALDLSGICN